MVERLLINLKQADIDPSITTRNEGQILHELDGVSVLLSKGSTDSAALGLIETNVHHNKMPSILSRVSSESLDAIGTTPHPAVLGDRNKYVPILPAQHAAPPEQEHANKPGGCWLIHAREILC
jgi:hypothetical protein